LAAQPSSEEENRIVRPALILAVTLLSAVAAYGDELRDTKPDYSRQALLRVSRDVIEHPRPRVSFDNVGEVMITSGIGRVHLLYGPVMPFVGSVARTTQEWPDPFALSGGAIAMSPEAWARH
jgi:hypothetical protein